MSVGNGEWIEHIAYLYMDLRREYGYWRSPVLLQVPFAKRLWTVRWPDNYLYRDGRRNNTSYSKQIDYMISIQNWYSTLYNKQIIRTITNQSEMGKKNSFRVVISITRTLLQSFHRHPLPPLFSPFILGYARLVRMQRICLYQSSRCIWPNENEKCFRVRLGVGSGLRILWAR